MTAESNPGTAVEESVATEDEWCKDVERRINQQILEAQEQLQAGREGEVDPLLELKAIWEGFSFSHNKVHHSGISGLLGLAVTLGNSFDEKSKEELARIRKLLEADKLEQADKALQNLRDLSSSSHSYGDLLRDIRNAISRREQVALFAKHQSLATHLCQTASCTPEQVFHELLQATDGDHLVVMRLLVDGFGDDARLLQAISAFPPSFFRQLI